MIPERLQRRALVLAFDGSRVGAIRKKAMQAVEFEQLGLEG